MMQLLEIRQGSLKVASRLGYPTNESLPLLDDVGVSRSPEEILTRSLSLFGVVAHSYGFPSESALSWLEGEGLTDQLSQIEYKYLTAGSGDSKSFQRQVESLWALTWALSIHENFDFSQLCSNDFIGLFPNVKTGESSQNFRSSVKFRGIEEVLVESDLAYCLHWGLTAAGISEKQIPNAVPIYVIANRRKALDWILCDEPWDEISLDT